MNGRLILNEAPERYYRRSLTVANNTGLKIIDERSPAHFKHWVEHPDADRETPALRFGKALHCAVLEPVVFDRTYCILPADAPDRPTQAMLNAKNPSASSLARMDWWAAWTAEHGDKTVLTASDYDRVLGMAESARRHPIAAGMLAGGKREVTLYWTEDVELPDGTVVAIECKARVDLWDEELAFFMDLKSTLDASAEGFGRSAVNYRYHVQHCHYGEGAKACGLDLRAFLFLAIESEPPYVCAPHTLPVALEEKGYELRDRSLRKQAACILSNTWPGYNDTGIITTAAPGWAFAA